MISFLKIKKYLYIDLLVNYFHFIFIIAESSS